MKTVTKTYRFKLMPNKEQEIFLSKHVGCTRFVYKNFLNERKGQYQENKSSDNYYEQAATLTKLKKHLSGKQKLKVDKIHEKIAHSTWDTLHNISYEIVRDNQVIAMEDLNVKGMVKNKKLSRHIADASWTNFGNLSPYKCHRYGRELVKVNRFFPSSKTSSVCGSINQDLTYQFGNGLAQT